MRRILLFTILIFYMSCTQAQIKSLDDFQWENRLLIIYTEGKNSSPLEEQLAEISRNKNGYKDRDLKVILLKDKEIEIWDSEQSIQLEFMQIIKELNINQNKSYQNLLIGKDGGVKLRSNSPISNEKLFDTIDAMPMRQREMRDGN